jgi:hypothetical protein
METALAQVVRLRDLLDDSATSYEQVAAHLDGLDAVERVRQCRALSKRQLRRLYDVAGAGPALTAEEMVSSAKEGQPVRYCGLNSLPLFRKFEKHFRSYEGQVVGINVQWHSFAVGPGYFTCGPADGKPNELLFDYTRVPAKAPDGWPRPRPNRGFPLRWVFKDMHDLNRRVSRDVVIGAATRLGRPINQFYVLARAE